MKGICVIFSIGIEKDGEHYQGDRCVAWLLSKKQLSDDKFLGALVRRYAKGLKSISFKMEPLLKVDSVIYYAKKKCKK